MKQSLSRLSVRSLFYLIWKFNKKDVPSIWYPRQALIFEEFRCSLIVCSSVQWRLCNSFLFFKMPLRHVWRQARTSDGLELYVWSCVYSEQSRFVRSRSHHRNKWQKRIWYLTPSTVSTQWIKFGAIDRETFPITCSDWLSSSNSMIPCLNFFMQRVTTLYSAQLHINTHTRTVASTVTCCSLPLLVSDFQRRTLVFLWVPAPSPASATIF
jgi:hypothetical protein